MNPRYSLSIVAFGMLLGGCCSRHGHATAQPAATNAHANRYELANRVADPLANYGEGTSAGIPNNPAVGRYPGPITPPVTPLMAVGD